MRKDIPLECAVLEWFPVIYESIPENKRGYVRVYWLGKDAPLRLSFTAGAVHKSGRWDKGSRIATLYIEAWHAIIRDGINPKEMHKALMVIPEYRDTLSADFPKVGD